MTTVLPWATHAAKGTDPQTRDHGATLPLPYRLITQFPQPSWIENIAVRPNGDLLLTQLSFTPSVTLYTVPNPSGASPSAVPVHTFDNINSLLGIAETRHPDVFAVVGGNSTTPGAFFVWTLDFRSDPARVTQVAHLANATLPNGLASLPRSDAVLIADSFAGLTWRVDIATGDCAVAAQFPEMAPPPGSPATTIGINGVKVSGGSLYWTNSATTTIYRLSVDSDGHPCKDAKVETVAKLDATFLDDFAVGDDGTLWVATNSDNRLFAVDSRAGGESVVVEGAVTELTLAGDTAASFGREKADRHVLYVVTCGGLRSPVNGTLTEGAKVVAVDTQGFKL